MRHNQAPAPNGFTLIEVLVSLVLLAVLSLALMQAFRFSDTVLSRVGARQAGIMAVNDTQTALRHWLGAAYPEYAPTQTPGLPGGIVFDGRPDGVTFLMPAPMSLVPGGMALMRVSLVKGTSSMRLLMSAQPELAWPDGVHPVQETLLIGISSASFAYWGADQPGTAAYWHSSWRGYQFLPRLIRIEMTFPSGDRRSWPELLIAPAIRTDSACQFVPLSMTCLGR